MLTFVHDHLFIEKDDLVYTSASFPYTVWKRYIDVFSKLVVIGRKHSKGFSVDGKAISSGGAVSFYFVKNYVNAKDIYLKTKRIYDELEGQLILSKYVIIRLPSRLGILAYLICKKKKIPFLIEVVGSWKDVLFHRGFNIEFPFIFYFNFLMKRGIMDATHVIYVTNYFLQKEYPTKGKYIGVSDVQLKPLIKTEIKKRFLKLDAMSNSSIIKIGMIGNLTMKYKGYATALKAMKELIGSGFKCELYLVGGGEFEWIIQIAQKYNIVDSIKFVGSLKSGKDIYSFLDLMDIYYQVSFVDSMPRALLEAMARGCLCIGSNVGDMPYLLSNNCIISAGDSNRLYQITTNYILNPSLAKKEVAINLKTIELFNAKDLSLKRDYFFKDFMNLSDKEAIA